jgi:hypothetical protein
MYGETVHIYLYIQAYDIHIYMFKSIEAFAS